MFYQMRAGVLYEEGGRVLARIRGSLCGSEKQVLSPEGELLLRTEIQRLGEEAPTGDVREKAYRMYAADGRECAAAQPYYAEEEDPNLVGWPICRLPHVDRARLTAGGTVYLLFMQNAQNYLLLTGSGRHVVQVLHRGVAGGWRLETAEEVPVGFLCGLFIFCRYLEKENEFLVV